MRGEDAVKFLVVNSVAKRLGFSIGFAELTIFGYGKHDPEDGPAGVGFSRVSCEENEPSVTNFVDANGNAVPQESIDKSYVIENSMVPWDAIESIIGGEHDFDEDLKCDEVRRVCLLVAISS